MSSGRGRLGFVEVEAEEEDGMAKERDRQAFELKEGRRRLKEGARKARRYINL